MASTSIQLMVPMAHLRANTGHALPAHWSPPFLSVLMKTLGVGGTTKQTNKLCVYLVVVQACLELLMFLP